MKYLLLLVLFYSCSVGINNSHKTEIQKFQSELNEEYLNETATPLRGRFYENFEQHPFFPINQKYRIEADYIKITDAEPFQMPTSSGKTQTYQAFAKATFTLDGKDHTLTIYQSQRLKNMPEYKNHLFLPFYDETNDVETYAGGRYIDLKMPNTRKIIIDFNKSYQPYCAYNLYDFSCPIVPSENRLEIRIPAGVKYNKSEFEH